MNSIVYISLCLFSFNIFHVTPGSLGPITSSLSRSRVVVFDIDDTLCKLLYFEEDKLNGLDIIRKNYPECPVISWTEAITSTYNSTHEFICLPYLQILFDYLLKEDVRIVFFSGADKKRNLVLIDDLLTSFWGPVKFETLKAKGQFDLLSTKNMREGNRSYHSGEGNYVKDLNAVIREGETLSDVILVEDDPSYVAYDQKPFLKIYSIWLLTGIGEVDHREKAKNEYPVLYWERTCPQFAFNSIYFMIAVFKTYFENEKYKILPFREALNEILPEKEYTDDFFEKHLFAYDMYDLGLSEVQKRVPNATFYGLKHPEIGTYGNKP